MNVANTLRVSSDLFVLQIVKVTPLVTIQRLYGRYHAGVVEANICGSGTHAAVLHGLTVLQYCIATACI